MPYEAPGKRVEVVAPAGGWQHGQFVFIAGKVGVVAKVDQIGRYVDPTGGTADDIAAGTHATLFIDGVHEAPLAGAIAAAVVGDLIWIHPADNTLHLAGTAAAGDHPVGVVDEIDTVRAPDVARINLNALHAFITHA